MSTNRSKRHSSEQNSGMPDVKLIAGQNAGRLGRLLTIRNEDRRSASTTSSAGHVLAPALEQQGIAGPT